MTQSICSSIFKESRQMKENEIQYTHISVKCTHVITDRRLERRKLYPFLYQMNENADKNYCCKKP